MSHANRDDQKLVYWSKDSEGHRLKIREDQIFSTLALITQGQIKSQSSRSILESFAVVRPQLPTDTARGLTIDCMQSITNGTEAMMVSLIFQSFLHMLTVLQDFVVAHALIAATLFFAFFAFVLYVLFTTLSNDTSDEYRRNGYREHVSSGGGPKSD